MITNPIILKLIECLEYVVEEDESDALEFNLEINGARLEGDEDWNGIHLGDFDCIAGMEMRTGARDYVDDGFEREDLKELLDLLRDAS